MLVRSSLFAGCKAIRRHLPSNSSAIHVKTPLVSHFQYKLNSTFNHSFVTSVIKWKASLEPLKVDSDSEEEIIDSVSELFKSEKKQDFLPKSDFKKVKIANDEDLFIQKCIKEDLFFNWRLENKKFAANWNGLPLEAQLSWLYENEQEGDGLLGKVVRGLSIKRIEGDSHFNRALDSFKDAQKILAEMKKVGKLNQTELRLEKIILKEINDIVGTRGKPA